MNKKMYIILLVIFQDITCSNFNNNGQAANMGDVQSFFQPRSFNAQYQNKNQSNMNVQRKVEVFRDIAHPTEEEKEDMVRKSCKFIDFLNFVVTDINETQKEIAERKKSCKQNDIRFYLDRNSAMKALDHDSTMDQINEQEKKLLDSKYVGIYDKEAIRKTGETLWAIYKRNSLPCQNKELYQKVKNQNQEVKN
jgi:hypothetical protein